MKRDVLSDMMAANSLSHGTCINLQHAQGLCMVFFLRHALHIVIWCMSPLMVGMCIRVCINLPAFINQFLSFALYDYGEIASQPGLVSD
jgi:hypothetical protein